MTDEWSEPMGYIFAKGTVYTTEGIEINCECGKPSVSIRLYGEGPKGICYECARREPYLPPRYEWDQVTNKAVLIK